MADPCRRVCVDGWVDQQYWSRAESPGANRHSCGCAGDRSCVGHQTIGAMAAWFPGHASTQRYFERSFNSICLRDRQPSRLSLHCVWPQLLVRPPGRGRAADTLCVAYSVHNSIRPHLCDHRRNSSPVITPSSKTSAAFCEKAPALRKGDLILETAV